MTDENIDEKLESKRIEMKNLIKKNRKLILQNYVLIMFNCCLAFIFLWCYFNPIVPVFKLLYGGCSGIAIFIVIGLIMTTMKSLKTTKNAEAIVNKYLNDGPLS